MMKEKLLKVFKDRDEAFIRKFCQVGTYLTDGAEVIHGVCKQISAEEMLNFMHAHDAILTNALLEVDE